MRLRPIYWYLIALVIVLSSFVYSIRPLSPPTSITFGKEYDYVIEATPPYDWPAICVEILKQAAEREQ